MYEGMMALFETLEISQGQAAWGVIVPSHEGLGGVGTRAEAVWGKAGSVPYVTEDTNMSMEPDCIGQNPSLAIHS